MEDLIFVVIFPKTLNVVGVGGGKVVKFGDQQGCCRNGPGEKWLCLRSRKQARGVGLVLQVGLTDTWWTTYRKIKKRAQCWHVWAHRGAAS